MRCILTDAELVPETDSEAHVIPSALGGRLAPKGLLSRVGNGILNHKVDLPLVRALAPLATLLGVRPDRGQSPLGKPS